MSNHGSATIASIIDGIAKNEYLIPAFQRKFTWSIERIEALFDSIMRGYPISTFLFYEPENAKKACKIPYLTPYHFFDDYDSTENYNKPVDKNVAIHKNLKFVLDGQQRMTALNIGLTGSYEKKKRGKGQQKTHRFYLYLDVANITNPHEDEETNFKYDFRFLTEDDMKKEASNNKLWVKVSELYNKLTDRNINFGDILFTLWDQFQEKNTDASKEHRNSINIILEKFKDTVIKGDLSYYTEKTDDYEDLKDIFIRINSGGVQLTKTDLLMTTIELYWGNEEQTDNARKMIDDLSKSLLDKGIEVSNNIILRSALISICNITEFKPESFEKDKVQKIKSNWDNVTDTWNRLISDLQKEEIKNQDIFSHYAVITLFDYYYHNIKAKVNIKEWLLVAEVMSLFSSHSNTTLKEYHNIIVANIGKPFPIIEFLSKKEQSIPDTDAIIDNLSYNDKGTRLLLSSIQNGISQRNGDYEVDHIFSKKIAANKNIDKDKYNSLVNLALLDDKTNRQKHTNDPLQYYQGTEHGSTMHSFAIIPGQMSLTWDNFDQFLALRRALLKDKIDNKFPNFKKVA
jgi:uncharacterized protein with ParB-like and HNH nuclease domain